MAPFMQTQFIYEFIYVYIERERDEFSIYWYQMFDAKLNIQHETETIVHTSMYEKCVES